MYLMEECALGMGQRSSDAAAKDVRTVSSSEECALSMGQKGSDTTAKDVQIEVKEEGCALGMGLRLRRNYAAAKDAQTTSQEWRSVQKARCKEETMRQ